MLFFHAQFMQRLRLRAALLERVLAGLGLAVQLLLALFMVLLVAPDLPRLLHLRAAAGDERDERGEAAHHVWGARPTRRPAHRSDSRAAPGCPPPCCGSTARGCAPVQLRESALA